MTSATRGPKNSPAALHATTDAANRTAAIGSASAPPATSNDSPATIGRDRAFETASTTAAARRGRRAERRRRGTRRGRDLSSAARRSRARRRPRVRARRGEPLLVGAKRAARATPSRRASGLPLVSAIDARRRLASLSGCALARRGIAAGRPRRRRNGDALGTDRGLRCRGRGLVAPGSRDAARRRPRLRNLSRSVGRALPIRSDRPRIRPRANAGRPARRRGPPRLRGRGPRRAGCVASLRRVGHGLVPRRANVRRTCCAPRDRRPPPLSELRDPVPRDLFRHRLRGCVRRLVAAHDPCSARAVHPAIRPGRGGRCLTRARATRESGASRARAPPARSCDCRGGLASRPPRRSLRRCSSSSGPGRHTTASALATTRWLAAATPGCRSSVSFSPSGSSAPRTGPRRAGWRSPSSATSFRRSRTARTASASTTSSPTRALG